jgi:hypothetical protein
VVLEIVAGIVVGPSVPGGVHVDHTISVISTLGLGFLRSWRVWRSTSRGCAGPCCG